MSIAFEDYYIFYYFQPVEFIIKKLTYALIYLFTENTLMLVIFTTFIILKYTNFLFFILINCVSLLAFV